MVEIVSLTTEYSTIEDRISLNCLLVDQKKVCVHVTHRLGRYVILELSKLLQHKQTDGRISGFKQSAAVLEKLKTEKVIIEDHLAPKHLLTKLDVKQSANKLMLIFRTLEGSDLSLSGDENLLRNFLDILTKSFKIANWQTSDFPSWLFMDGDKRIERSLLN